MARRRTESLWTKIKQSNQYARNFSLQT